MTKNSKYTNEVSKEQFQEIENVNNKVKEF
ncbi:TPA: hypothetical protein J8F44_002679, partial [Staphylococcus aureus]|nr:hypothetical protein [Staphylococcus aureus]HAZ6042911.1 hypothetical protein [Staphylococcus aureus]HCD7270484.1 hypothetical protein [Staphylococcus aureus]HCD8891995.1 hypothetical protein [Staphylococcus aureus]HCW8571520.1 hypothetical protein [Staphylococcus aureus]